METDLAEGGANKRLAEVKDLQLVAVKERARPGGQHGAVWIMRRGWAHAPSACGVPAAALEARGLAMA